MYESLSLFSEPTKMWFRACLRSADRGTGSDMAGNPFRSQCLGHRPYRFRQNIGCVSLSHRPIDDRATHAACRCACAVYLAVKGARGRCGQEPRTAFEGHCRTMRGARAARAEDRGRHSFRRHHRTGAAAHSLPSTGYPRYHARNRCICCSLRKQGGFSALSIR